MLFAEVKRIVSKGVFFRKKQQGKGTYIATSVPPKHQWQGAAAKEMDS
jgi:hypothetical protein